MYGKVTSIELVHNFDECFPIEESLGKFTDKEEDWAICRACGKFVIDTSDDHDCYPCRNSYIYFIPFASGYEPGSEEYKTYGMQDWRRAEQLNMGEWAYIIVRLKVGVLFRHNDESFIHYFESGGLGGVEDDCGDEYMIEIANDELALIKEELTNLDVDLSEVDNLMKNLNLSPEINYSM